MSTFPKISALLMVIGLAAAIGLSAHLTENRVKTYKIGSEKRAAMKYMPALGIDKFYADISWMFCINHLGGIQGQMAKREAEYFKKRFDRITDLDPDFDAVYRIGAASIAYVDNDPTMAIDLVEKAIRCQTKMNWYHPWQAANWVMQILVHNAKGDSKAHFDKAIDYLQTAVREGGPWYVENMLLNTITKKANKDQDDFTELEAWYEYYAGKIKELQSKQSELQSKQSAMSGPGGAPMPMGGAPMMMGLMVEGGESALGKLRMRILDRCRQLVADCLAEEAKAKPEEKAALTAKAEAVRTIFGKMKPQGYYCPKSLLAYEAGELFDSMTGVAVAPYGVDLYDLEKNGRNTVVKGEFNTLTGKPVARTFSDLEAALAKENAKLSRLAGHHPEKTGQAEMMKPAAPIPAAGDAAAPKDEAKAGDAKPAEPARKDGK